MPQILLNGVTSGGSFHCFLSCRLNSAIIGTPITLLSTNYHYTHTAAASSRGRGKGAAKAAQSAAIVKAAALATGVGAVVKLSLCQ